jgi:hypothetical protein
MQAKPKAGADLLPRFSDDHRRRVDRRSAMSDGTVVQLGKANRERLGGLTRPPHHSQFSGVIVPNSPSISPLGPAVK